MKTIAFVPVYKWGEDPDSHHGSIRGTSTYLGLEDLYYYEDEAVGHIEIEVNWVTENEFRRLYGLKSGAV